MVDTTLSRVRTVYETVQVQVTGRLPFGALFVDWHTIVRQEVGNLRLKSVSYAVGDGVELLVAWDKKWAESPNAFLPLSGRGSIDFHNVEGIDNTVEKDQQNGIVLRVDRINEMIREVHFLVTLDFEKQGG